MVLENIGRDRWRQASEKSSLRSKTIQLAELRPVVQQGKLWAIIDACDEPKVPKKMREELGPERAVSLYRGDAEIEQAEIAPYLAQVDEDLLRWIVDELWEKPWGFFILAETDLDTLRSHFRRFLTVKDPEGEKMYFRFYDPRILTPFLRVSTEDELASFVGDSKLGIKGVAQSEIEVYRINV